ncbi:MAG: TetR/AcrR family transcriptional regulator [Acidimicrobiia bacterium]|nr:TetR/AcrR family transcriptional regulator [Acidimicrobiia bacterium]
MPTSPTPQTASDSMRARILDTVGTLLADMPWNRVSMREVAQGTGVSRQTVYNEFENRELLAKAYVLRETGRFMDAVDQVVTANADNPREAVRAAVNVFLVGAAHHPVLHRVAHGDWSDGLLEVALTPSEAQVVGVAVLQLRDVILRNWGFIAAPAANNLANGAVRLALSYAAMPIDPDDTDASTDAIMAILNPVIDSAT